MKIIYTNTFRIKYLKIKNYYECTYNENVIVKLNSGLILLEQVLEVFPQAYGVIYKNHYRKAIINGYVIIYFVKDDKVVIANIFHGNENYLTKI